MRKIPFYKVLIFLYLNKNFIPQRLSIKNNYVYLHLI